MIQDFFGRELKSGDYVVAGWSGLLGIYQIGDLPEAMSAGVITIKLVYAPKDKLEPLNIRLISADRVFWIDKTSAMLKILGQNEY